MRSMVEGASASTDFLRRKQIPVLAPPPPPYARFASSGWSPSPAIAGADER
jgi:hypothetical protein